MALVEYPRSPGGSRGTVAGHHNAAEMLEGSMVPVPYDRPLARFPSSESAGRHEWGDQRHRRYSRASWSARLDRILRAGVIGRPRKSASYEELGRSDPAAETAS